MSKKLALILVCFIVLSIFITGCNKEQVTQGSQEQNTQEETNGKEPIIIGHQVPLTGDSSMWGQSESNALKLEVEKINNAGGIEGRPIKLITYDNRADAVEAVNTAKRMIEQDKVVAIIGPGQSGPAIAISSVTEDKKIPFIATSATNPLVTVTKDDKVKKYAFRTCFIDPFQGTVLAQFAYNKLNAKNAAILYDVGSDYSAWLANYFEDDFEKLGGSIVAKEAFRTGELDYRAMLGKIKEAKPDIILLTTSQKEAALAAKQARELGIDATFLGGDNWGSPDLIKLGGSAIEGSYFSAHASLDDPDLKTFIDEYKERYNMDPVIPNPLFAIDAIQMLTDAIKRAGTTDGPALAEAIEATKDLKVLTGNLTVDSTNHNPLNKPAVILQIKNNKFEYVEKFVTQ